MPAHFYKYQGAGNDFIVIDNRDGSFQPGIDVIATMCQRKFGIGGDGLMLLEASGDYDFSMRYYNSDGKESTMCGNGGRCMVAFAHALGLINSSAVFLASDGPHHARILSNGLISINMRDVTEIRQHRGNHLIDTGSPHFVIHVEDTETVDVIGEGKAIRYNKNIAKDGVNVNFIHCREDQHIHIRTYERGVEDETLACGTGSVAAAISAHLRHPSAKSSYILHAPGGELQVHFDQQNKDTFTNIWLTGPAEFVFEGWK
ncbi:MAG TPA: diaminopimelate epimerase [Bacteroidales bacterium]|nr:diaminopimelate epimerase [Bacteroidales bacterium]